MTKTLKDRNGIDFAVGDGVNWSEGTDTEPGHITRVSATGKTVWAVAAKAKLLNAVGSAAPDALKFYPGGFHGHTAGTQRHAFTKGDGPEIRFTLRKRGVFQMAKASSTGSMRTWGVLYPGLAKHYDFNF